MTISKFNSKIHIIKLMWGTYTNIHTYTSCIYVRVLRTAQTKNMRFLFHLRLFNSKIALLSFEIYDILLWMFSRMMMNEKIFFFFIFFNSYVFLFFFFLSWAATFTHSASECSSNWHTFFGTFLCWTYIWAVTAAEWFTLFFFLWKYIFFRTRT